MQIEMLGSASTSAQWEHMSAEVAEDLNTEVDLAREVQAGEGLTEALADVRTRKRYKSMALMSPTQPEISL